MTNKPYKRIATEEAWASKELYDGYRKVLKDRPNEDAGFTSLWTFYLNNPSPRPASTSRIVPISSPSSDAGRRYRANNATACCRLTAGGIRNVTLTMKEGRSFRFRVGRDQVELGSVTCVVADGVNGLAFDFDVVLLPGGQSPLCQGSGRR